MPPLPGKLGFIGAGNMAEALIGAAIRSGFRKAQKILASDVSDARLAFMREKHGITTTTDNLEVVETCSLIVLAVKPQQMEHVLAGIVSAPGWPPPGRKLFLSIAAGIPLARLEASLSKGLAQEAAIPLPVIRVMPNTPALVGEGMAAIAPNAHCGAEDLELAVSLFEGAGKVLVVPEPLMDAVTAVSGSGPAYVFYLAEAMLEGAGAVGLGSEDARVLVVQTILGAARLLAESGEEPGALRKKVTSPGGTTEAAIRHMEEEGVRENIALGIRAAAKRSGELSRPAKAEH
jgi:pyrroline-5-carboxylate reductase